MAFSSRFLALLLAPAATLAQANGFICPTYVRAVHTFNPSAGNVPAFDFYINGQLVANSVNFRDVTPYINVRAGSVNATIRTAGAAANAAPLSGVVFMAVPGQSYTIGFTGGVMGPAGQILSNASPFVNPDVRMVPNPGRFSGLWYRWSETNLAIDFRAIAGNPSAPWGVGNASDVERISTLQPKTVIPYGEIPTQTISFYPAGMGSNAPLFNAQRNEYVAVTGLTPNSREWVDIIATGDSLLAPHTNTLALVFTRTSGRFDPSTGCTFISGVPGSATPVSGAATTGVSAAVLLLLAGGIATSMRA